MTSPTKLPQPRGVIAVALIAVAVSAAFAQEFRPGSAVADPDEQAISDLARSFATPADPSAYERNKSIVLKMTYHTGRLEGKVQILTQASDAITRGSQPFRTEQAVRRQNSLDTKSMDPNFGRPKPSRQQEDPMKEAVILDAAQRNYYRAVSQARIALASSLQRASAVANRTSGQFLASPAYHEKETFALELANERDRGLAEVGAAAPPDVIKAVCRDILLPFFMGTSQTETAASPADAVVRILGGLGTVADHLSRTRQ